MEVQKQKFIQIAVTSSDNVLHVIHALDDAGTVWQYQAGPREWKQLSTKRAGTL